MYNNLPLKDPTRQAPEENTAWLLTYQRLIRIVHSIGTSIFVARLHVEKCYKGRESLKSYKGC